MSKPKMTMNTCGHCGGSTPIVGAVCISCGAPNEVGQAMMAAIEATLEAAGAKRRLPSDTRSIDLTPESILAFRAEKLGVLVQVGRELGFEVLDFRIGNVGRHSGQYVVGTVGLPSDSAQQNEVRENAIGLMLYVFAGEPDVVSVRVEFADGRRRLRERVVIDTADCTADMAVSDEAMAEYRKTHTRTEKP